VSAALSIALLSVSLRHSLRNFPQRLQDLLIRRPFSVVDFDKFPADYSLSVDDISRRVGPPFAVGIEDAIAVDDLVVFVLEHGKIQVPRESLFEFLHKFLRILVAIDADC